MLLLLMNSKGVKKAALERLFSGLADEGETTQALMDALLLNDSNKCIDGRLRVVAFGM